MLTQGHTYRIDPPGVTARVVLIDRDSAGNPVQVWLEQDDAKPSLLILAPGMTFTPTDEPEPTRPTYTVKDLGQDDRSAEDLVAEATAERGTGVAVGPHDKILPRPEG